MTPGKDTTLDLARLGSDPAYYAERLAVYEANPVRWLWYVRQHTHTCKHCARQITHTGLEAERGGLAAHLCCGQDVRG